VWARVLGVVPAVTLVDIAAVDLAAGKLLGILDDVTQGVTVIGIAGQCLYVAVQIVVDIAAARCFRKACSPRRTWRISPASSGPSSSIPNMEMLFPALPSNKR